MTTKQKKTVKPLYTLPGEDSLGVQTIGYSHGLNILARMLFDQLPPDAPLPEEGVLSNMPTEQAEIDEMARDLSIENLTSWLVPGEGKGKRPVTNSPELFCEHYAESFKEGYRFGMYAFSHGYLELSYSLPDSDRRYELAFRFAWEKMHGKPDSDSDTLMSNALEELKAIYKLYQSLN